MPWLLLIFAVICEVIGTLSLKLSNGFTVLTPSAVVVVGYGASFFLLAHVLKSLEVGTAYAVWSGLGTAIVAVAGVFIFNESISAAKIVCIALIVAGVVGLHFFDGGTTRAG